ncbi:MAG: anion permease [Candidatus Bipolaricaulota bacterium]
MWALLPGILMGWSLGTNDAANVFGLGVGARALSYRAAVVLTSGFVILGAYVGGARGMATYGALAGHDLATAFCVGLAAGLTVTLMTVRRIPVSATQAAVGAIIGVALVAGQPVEWGVLVRIGASWVTSPLGSLIIAYTLHRFVSPLVEGWLSGVAVYNTVLRWGIVLVGILGSYALGANSVANVTGVYVGAGLLSVPAAAVLGGASIGLGVLTYSRRVMETVGEGLVHLGLLPALFAAISQAAILRLFAYVGVPVSTSQAVVGAVLGIGLVRGVQTVNLRQMAEIGLGWVLTPVLAGMVGALLWLALGWALPS